MIDVLIKGGDIPFRPDLPQSNESQEAELVARMTKYWDEDPEKRPDFDTIKKHMKQLNRGRYTSQNEIL